MQRIQRCSSFHRVAPHSGLSLPSEHPLPAAFNSPITSKTLVCGIKQNLQHLQIQVMAYVCTNRWLWWDKTMHSAWTRASWIGIMRKLKNPLTSTFSSSGSETPDLSSGSAKKCYSVYVQISGHEDTIFFRFILQLHSYNVSLRPVLHPCLLWFPTKRTEHKPRGVPSRFYGLCKHRTKRIGHARNTPGLQSTDR